MCLGYFWLRAGEAGIVLLGGALPIDLSLEDPALDANGARCRVSLGEAVVNVGRGVYEAGRRRPCRSHGATSRHRRGGPDAATRMPLAPNFIAVCIARLRARRKATRRSSC